MALVDREGTPASPIKYNITLLYSFGLLQFKVFPVNIKQVDHQTTAEWARKEIAGAATYREWVGEGDEEIIIRGQLFPLFMKSHGKPDGLKGDDSIELLENMRRMGVAQMLIRGDGY